MKVIFNTYPMAFHTIGGGEIQLIAYKENLPAYGVEVTLFDQQNPCLLEQDLVHFFLLGRFSSLLRLHPKDRLTAHSLVEFVDHGKDQKTFSCRLNSRFL
jgi:hypothetical protein